MPKLAPSRPLSQMLSFALLGLCLSTAACDRPTCLGMHPLSTNRNAPSLVHVALVEQQVQSPWTLLLAVDFLDRDGDVGNGNMLVFVGASSPVTIPLAEAFATSELNPAATSGRFGLPLFVGQGAVPGDTVLRLGFQLQDEREHYSNCYAMDLFYTVDLPTAAQSVGPTTVTAWRTEQVACP